MAIWSKLLSLKDAEGGNVTLAMRLMKENLVVEDDIEDRIAISNPLL